MFNLVLLKLAVSQLRLCTENIININLQVSVALMNTEAIFSLWAFCLGFCFYTVHDPKDLTITDFIKH